MRQRGEPPALTQPQQQSDRPEYAGREHHLFGPERPHRTPSPGVPVPGLDHVSAVREPREVDDLRLRMDHSAEALRKVEVVPVEGVLRVVAAPDEAPAALEA